MCLYPVSIRTHPKQGESQSVVVSCGQCLECLKQRSIEWSFRIMDEAKLYPLNCFITLTFSPEYLPLDGSISKRDVQLFMKRLRKFVFPLKIRFFASGEYGSKRLRPHYHIIIFGYDFPDKYFFKYDGKTKLYRSPSLEKLWTFGFSSVGEVTYDSALYCAKYMQKVQFQSFRKLSLTEPFILMSNRPGIGYASAYNVDLKSLKIYRNGKFSKIPRYYIKVMERDGVYLDDYKEACRINGEEKSKTIDLIAKRKKFYDCFMRLPLNRV